MKFLQHWSTSQDISVQVSLLLQNTYALWLSAITKIHYSFNFFSENYFYLYVLNGI